MSKKKIVIAVAAVLAGAGAIAAISAPGPRGHRGMQDDGHGGLERRGWFGRELTKDAYDTRVRERFAALDKNSDGFIDAGELEAAMQRSGGPMARWRAARGGDQAGQNPMLQRLDANKDGKVTRDEFQAAIRKAFAEADLDSDGKITDADLPPMLRGTGAIARMAASDGMSMGGGRGMMRGAGRDGSNGMGMGGPGGGLGRLLQGAEVKDGSVALDAVLAASNRRFDRFDRNKDGVLDRADREAMTKEMADYRAKRFVHAHGADKDGKVSREQFFAKATERFAAMDFNGDGKLGRGEIGRRGMRHEGGMHDGMGRDRDGGPRGGRGPGGPGPSDAPAPKQQ